MNKILNKWPFAVSGVLVGVTFWLMVNDDWLITKIVKAVAAVVVTGALVWIMGDAIRYMVTKHGDNDAGQE
jgi:hypothetical protein